MDTQNTPVHLRLWHRDFWLLSLANLMLSSMVYMLIPIMPSHLMKYHGFSTCEVGAVAISYAIGLFSAWRFHLVSCAALSSQCGVHALDICVDAHRQLYVFQ